MSYYQVMLEGKDFPVVWEGNEEVFGFFTTRWVKASNDKEAELNAVELIKNDSSLVDMTLSKAELTPMIYLVEIQTVNWLTYVRKSPGRGYSFYSQGDSENEN